MGVSVNYHQFILGSNDVLFLNIANITLVSFQLDQQGSFLSENDLFGWTGCPDGFLGCLDHPLNRGSVLLPIGPRDQ